MSLRIAVIEGDGIGKEIVPAGIRVVEAAARLLGVSLAWERLDWGCDRHARFGCMTPKKGLERVAGHDAIFLGARRFPSMFEPAHGSAPDIAGRNVANPIGQIRSGALMLEHLGAAEAVVSAIERAPASGENLTRDMGGTAATASLGMAIADAVSAHAERGAAAYG